MSHKTLTDLATCAFETREKRIGDTGSVYCTKLEQYVGANYCAYQCSKRQVKTCMRVTWTDE